ncbi:MAG: translation elongation factor Ts, partial [Cyanobacteria bacterium M5B4]
MAEISSQMITELRSRTQAGIKDCKKALIENNGDMTQAIEWLRKRGITKAGDKADRVTAEGIVHSYIHFGSRIGVLVELNCETDFVAKREEFKELADNIAKQIAACSGVEYVSVAHIPPEVVAKEKAIESAKDDLASKPEAVREKIVQGRIEKRLKELSLLDQPYIKDQSITVDELIKGTVAKLKENIRVRRFVRYSVGEEIAGETTPEVKTSNDAQPAQASDEVVAAPEPVQASDEVVATPEPVQASDEVV